MNPSRRPFSPIDSDVVRPFPPSRFRPAASAEPGLRSAPVHRVLMTSGRNPASWNANLDLAAALGRCGIEVVLAAMGPAPSPEVMREVGELPNLQMVPGRFEPDWGTDSWGEVERAGEWLLRLEEHLAPDVVQVHSYAYGALPFRAPVVLAGHDCPLCRAWVVGEETASWLRYRKAVGAALDSAHLVVTPTEAALAELESLFGPVAAARTIPAARSGRRFLPAAKEDLILAAPEGAGLEVLTAAAADLPWQVGVVGVSADDGAAPGLRFLGPMAGERLAGWLGRAAIFTLPRAYEPTGLPVLEAALAGCALVLPDLPGLRERWDGAALFVEPGDPSDLARALTLLIDEDKGRRGLGQRARSRALAFTPERRAGAFLEVYADLLKAGGVGLPAVQRLAV